MKLSSDSKSKICLYTLTVLAPIVICILLGVIIGKQLADNEITIYSPQDLISNVVNMLSIIIGFLLTFLGLVLGFATTKSMRTIINNPAPRYKLIINLFTPFIGGILLILYILYISATMPNDRFLIIKGNDLAKKLSYIVAFFASIVKTTFCFLPIVKSIASEDD